MDQLADKLAKAKIIDINEEAKGLSEIVGEALKDEMPLLTRYVQELAANEGATSFMHSLITFIKSGFSKLKEDEVPEPEKEEDAGSKSG